MGEIIELRPKSNKKQEPKYTAQRFRNIAMDQALAKVISNTITQHLKSTTASIELDQERFDLIIKEITKNINKTY